MKIILSKKDQNQLALLNKQLSDYDAALLSRLSNELNKKQALLPDNHIDLVNSRIEFKMAFLNDLGRKEILSKIERFYAITIPTGIEID